MPILGGQSTLAHTQAVGTCTKLYQMSLMKCTRLFTASQEPSNTANTSFVMGF